MQDAIKAYIKALQKEFATGHATEHTYRPALKALLESVILGRSNAGHQRAERRLTAAPPTLC